jgi:hypothetical protein
MNMKNTPPDAAINKIISIESKRNMLFIVQLYQKFAQSSGGDFLALGNIT